MHPDGLLIKLLLHHIELTHYKLQELKYGQMLSGRYMTATVAYSIPL
jgi:hypothetical protein